MFLDPARQHDDLRLLRRAIKKRWEIPEEFRGIVVDRLKSIICGHDEELALKAIAEVRHLESQNQKDEHKVLDVRVATRHDELDAIAADLGLEVGAIEDATGQSGGGDLAVETDGRSATAERP